MSCINPLQELKDQIKHTVEHKFVTADEVVEAVRESLVELKNDAQAVSRKSNDILDKLKTPFLYSKKPAVGEYFKPSVFADTSGNESAMTIAGGDSDDFISFGSGYYPQAAYFVNDGLMGGAGNDTISLG